MANRDVRLYKSHMKVMEKEEKKDNSAIKSLQLDLVEKKHQLELLERDIDIINMTYNTVAKDKVERKLKLGVVQDQADRLKSAIDNARSKHNTQTNSKEDRVKMLETELQECTQSYDTKIRVLEQDLKTCTQKYETKIENLESEKGRKEKLIQSKIDRLESNVKDIQINEDVRQTRLNKELDKCYSDPPIVPTFPPTHFKKKQQMKDLEGSIKRTTERIMNLQSAEIEDRDKAKHDASDAKLAMMRAQARLEGEQQNKESEARQYEMECQMAASKKEDYAADKARAKQLHEDKMAADIIVETDADLLDDYSYHFDRNETEHLARTIKKLKGRGIPLPY